MPSPPLVRSHTPSIYPRSNSISDRYLHTLDNFSRDRPQAALHNILCNRLLLRLRSANTSLSEEGFLSIHISERLDSLIPLSELDSKGGTTATSTTKT